jgi:predicted TIM-barrel fold metal-dependent hydrolase
MSRMGTPQAAQIWDANALFGTVPFKDADHSLSTLLGLMSRHGIARAAAYSMKGVYYDFEEGNDDALAAARQNERLLPVMTVDPRRYLGCVAEVSRRANQGCRALRLFPDTQGWPVRSLALRPILEQAERCGIAVMMPASVGGMATDAVAAVTGLGLPLILIGAGYGTMAEVIAAARARPEVYIETHRLDTPDALDVIAQAVGHERLVFGSGAPEVYPASALALVAHSGLSSTQKQDVLCGNLRRALGL